MATITEAAPSGIPSTNSTRTIRSLYMGIDVGRKSHKAALVPVEQMRGHRLVQGRQLTPSARPHEPFQGLVGAISDITTDPEQVAIAIDHTGGHYSAPLYHYLVGSGYTLTYPQLRPRGRRPTAAPGSGEQERRPGRPRPGPSPVAQGRAARAPSPTSA